MALYDVVQANRQAVQTGTALGQAMFSNSLRMQQLKSEQALQQLQQQQAAEMLSWTIRQHHMAIDQEAENAKRASVFQSMITPTLSMPANDMTEFAPMIGPDGQPMAKPTVTNGMTQVPNPAYVPNLGEAYIKAFLPGNPDPAKVMATGGALMLHQGQMQEQQALAEKNKAEALFQPRVLDKDGVKLLEYSPGHFREVHAGSEGATGNMEKNLEYLKGQKANGEITEEQYQNAKEIVLKLAPPASAAAEWMNRSEVHGLLEMRTMLMKNQILAEDYLGELEAQGEGMFGGNKKAIAEAKRKAKSWKARVEEVNKQIEVYRPKNRSVPSTEPPPPPPGGGDNVLIKTPKGAIIPIPRSNLPEALKHGATEYGPGKPGYEG